MVTYGTGGVGLIPYVSGLAASTGAAIVLDGQVQQKIAIGDYSGAVDQATYHLPGLGSSRSLVEALIEGNTLGALLSSGSLGAEVLPFIKGGRVPGVGVVNQAERGALKVSQVLPNIETLFKSAGTAWKQGVQDTLSNAGRALQKHSSRLGSAFSNIKFSTKTANQDAMKIIQEIMASKNQYIRPGPQRGYQIFDTATGRGFAVSDNGAFIGFRELKDAMKQ